MRFFEYARDPDRAVDKVLGEFDNGMPAILPTDTVYGLAAPVGKPDAVRKIFKLKQRPEGMTLPVVVSSVDEVGTVGRIDDRIDEFIRERLPGPFTFVLESRFMDDPLIVRNKTMAVRVVGHPLFPELCRESGPIALTSANIHGKDPIMDPGEASVQFGEADILMIIDQSRIKGIPSTLIDLTGSSPKTLREGKVNMGNCMRGHNGPG